MKATIKDRIVAHRSAPDVYDPPSFEQMADHIEKLETRLAKAEAMFEREIRRVKKIQLDLPKPHTVSLFSVQCEYELMLAELTGGKDE